MSRRCAAALLGAVFLGACVAGPTVVKGPEPAAAPGEAPPAAPSLPAPPAVPPPAAPPTAVVVFPPPAPAARPKATAVAAPTRAELSARLEAWLARYALFEYGPSSTRTRRLRQRLDELAGSPVDARALEARARELLGDEAGARAVWQGLVEDGQGGPEAVVEYARLAARTGAEEEALALLALRLDESPRDPDLGGVLGWLLLRTGNPVRARGNLENTWGTPAAPRFAAALGRVRLVAGDLDGAKVAAELAASQPGAGAGAWVLLGDVRRAEGLASAAAEAYRRALALTPADYPALVALGLLRLREGNAAEAAGFFREAGQASPAAPEAWNGLGLALRAQGDYRGAVEAYGKALAADARFAPALKNLGLLNEKYLGRPADALPLYDRYLAVRPGDAEVERWRKAAGRVLGKAAP